MKDGMDSTAARQAPERTQEEEFVSRKLIRPSLSSPAPRTEPVSERRERLERTDRAPSSAVRRNGPPEQTHGMIMHATGFPPATVHRLLAELIEWGAVERTGRGRYRLPPSS